jgi:ABC-type proline/glycine betaine transport system permease subunit
MIRAHPMLGVGVGNFAIEMERITQPAQTIEPMHSLPLLAFSELGIGAVIILIGLGGVIFAGLQRAQQPVNIIYGAALIGVFVASLFDHYFWTLAPGRMMLGMMLGLWAGTADPYVA